MVEWVSELGKRGMVLVPTGNERRDTVLRPVANGYLTVDVHAQYFAIAEPRLGGKMANSQDSAFGSST